MPLGTCKHLLKNHKTLNLAWLSFGPSWWGTRIPLWKTVWSFLKKLKIELPYNPAIPLLGIYPEKTIIQKESCGLPWWRSG